MFAQCLSCRNRLLFLILFSASFMGMYRPLSAQEIMDPANLTVRLGRLEEQMRKLNGEIEQLRHENILLRQQIEKNLPPQGGSSVKTDAASDQKTSAKPTSQRRTDSRKAFDPKENPDAEGAPKPLGTSQHSSALTEEELNALNAQTLPDNKETTDEETIEEGIIDNTNPDSIDITDNPASNETDETADQDSQEALDEFLTAQDYMQSEQYEKAEFQFKKYLHDHPKDMNVPSAIYGLGQSYAKRGRHREAAEQFILIATDYKTSETAPDAMVKLGLSLQAMGVTDKACALFGEVKKRYPDADPMVLQAADRERRSLCRQ